MALGLLGGVWRPKAVVRNIVLVMLPAIALGYGVFLTHSRGGTVAFLVALWRPLASLLGGVGGTILLIVLASGAVALDFGGGREIFLASDDSAEGRVTAWTEGLQMLKAQPILGVGYNLFREYYTQTAHNSFVQSFAETGMIGYFFLVGINCDHPYRQLSELKKLPRAQPIDSELKAWATALQVSLMGFLAGAFFLSRTFVPILYLVIGLSVALMLIAQQEGRRVWSPSLPRLSSLVVACEVVIILVISGHEALD